jgi:hypothetical protein
MLDAGFGHEEASKKTTGRFYSINPQPRGAADQPRALG